MMRGDILREAETVINGARQNCYGDPEDSFLTIAQLWNGYLFGMHGRLLGPVDVAMMMSLLKVARLKSNPMDRDGYRDLCGYAALACDMAGAKDMEKE